MKKIILFLCCSLWIAGAFAQCPDSTRLGMASNIFTHILNETNPVIYEPDLNTVIFIHRHNAAQFGGHSGNLRYDISTNGGATWTRNQGLLNPASVNGTNAARYPNISIYNPPGNTVVDSAYLVYQAATVATTWNGVCTGVRQLDGTGNTENYNQAASTLTLIPRSQVKGKPGEFWAIDAIWNGTAVSGYRILKGVWNNTTKNVTWAINATLIPPFNTTSGGVVSSDFNIAFDPTGEIGWACMLTHITPGPSDQSFYPVFYHTEDAGSTWTGPEQVDLNDFQCITNNIGATNVPTTAFDLDLEVDINGDPHALVGVGNGSGAYGIFFTQWHAMYDFNKVNGIWNAVQLDTLNAGRATFGTAPNTTTQDQFSQSSRTEDGSKLFFTYTDSRSGLLGGENIVPDLYGVAYDAVNRLWTTSRNLTACNPSMAGKVFYPHLSPIAKEGAGTWTLPLVYAQFAGSGEPIDPTTFIYGDSVQFTSSDFFIPLCNVPVTISASDTVIACASVQLDGGNNHDAYLWSTGDTTRFITVTTSGTYRVGVRDICCTGGDSVVVIINPLPTSSFGATSTNLALTLSDSSMGTPASWLWDFGDGNTSTSQNPTHGYNLPGTYTVCLTVTNGCGTDSSCQTVTVTCPAPIASFSSVNNDTTVSFTDLSGGIPASWHWDFGDGDTTNIQDPTHTYGQPGTYVVCLSIANPCGGDTICDTITVTCPAPVASFGIDSTNQLVAYVSNASVAGGNSYLWDFGDGTTDTSANPQSHTYINAGDYDICLTVTNICGADTVCDSVSVIFIGREESWVVHRLEIFPVPARERITLRGEVAGNQSIDLTLVDALGRSVREFGEIQVAQRFERELDLAGLPGGIYLLQLTTQQGKMVRKILKED